MTSGSTSFSSLDGIGSNIHVVVLDDLTSSGFSLPFTVCTYEIELHHFFL